eukprot:TRINITY_DN16505_c0_g1_i1.p1 TRINITY_DN16505_c0_g1~~TRINITY_DN16505_c0_g1_i1.p1  ORF type:complete len:181 (+),score=16.96 TRINITY_DN16505_c0_g1_i1:66-608(+)
MRPLTDEETRIFFEKLARYLGRNLKYLIDRTDEDYVFRLHKDRVYYMSEQIMRKATNVSQKHLLSVGTCFGKFTKSRQFKIHITALDYLAMYAKYKIWVKPSSEMSFLYGNHVLKSGLGRITENTPVNQGVVVFSMSDVALGFGVTAKSTVECRKLAPNEIVCLHQADVGEYLRQEASMI